MALAASPPASKIAVVYLAQALVAAGRADRATTLLADAVDNLGRHYYGIEASTLVFALAVAYDQDEQLSKAYQTLDRLQNALSSGYAAQLQQSLARLELVPAIERHYWQGLLYESAGFDGEARAEWLDYAAAGPRGPLPRSRPRPRPRPRPAARRADRAPPPAPRRAPPATTDRPPSVRKTVPHLRVP